MYSCAIAPDVSTKLESEPHSPTFLLSPILPVSNTFPAHSWEVGLSHALEARSTICAGLLVEQCE